jgi:cation diffusion facilitator family transporter
LSTQTKPPRTAADNEALDSPSSKNFKGLPWSKKTCQDCAAQIVFWTIIANIFLTVLKMFGGYWSGSKGLMADGMQSLSCVLASVMIWISLKLAQKAPNSKFPYGYGKVEYLVALGVFSILMALGLFIAIESGIYLLEGKLVTPDLIGLPFVIISVFMTYMIFRYNVCAGQKLDSVGLMANGLQAKADLWSSTAVTLGILLSQLGPGFAAADHLAALIVGLMIVVDGGHHWYSNLKVLLDVAPDTELTNKINQTVSEICVNHKTEGIRIIRMGTKLWVGVTIDFNNGHSLAQIEEVSTKITALLKKRVKAIAHVDVYLEPIA